MSLLDQLGQHEQDFDPDKQSYGVLRKAMDRDVPQMKVHICLVLSCVDFMTHSTPVLQITVDLRSGLLQCWKKSEIVSLHPLNLTRRSLPVPRRLLRGPEGRYLGQVLMTSGERPLLY